MGSLALAYSDVYNRVCRFLRLASTATGDDLTLCQEITDRAYRNFLYPVHPETGYLHTWSFLRKRATLRTEIGEHRYQLGSDFVSILTSPKLVGGENLRNPEYIDVTKYNGLRTKSVVTGTPEYYCVDIGDYHPELGQLHEIKLWKVPDAVLEYEYHYIFEPDGLEESTDRFVGGARASEVILQMAIAEAEKQEDENDGEQQKAADKLLFAYMAWDKAYAMNAFGPGWDDARQVARPVSQPQDDGEQNGS